MIINFILNLFVDILALIFYIFDPITVLPTIGGVDIDYHLLTAMGWLNRIFEVVWPLEIVFHASLFIIGYYVVKLFTKFFLGSRTPGQ